ncbi:MULTISPECIES: cupin domain-containing protein [Pseudonocardia]|uniref:Cupin domain protein n=2 Tax=Pseudonocardia TaxID=1847 RepID=A0A1Y2MMF7_PSEAH|nr:MULTISPECIES: cupin domain-containing protein [Pseudonocardia]OSY36271.1 Cupin domain protein [Pseudonocardia autotrophica]TDN73078.1 uncharacterized protein DUF861 [Pseudonocardia autotrophica]BBG03796.1 hypothetical protein Pdca_50050 [Pseudonocardia autotrophica]GEC26596.1 hypothetical protein PSA01_36250 [Pseudonocardia saturnea]
MTAATQTAFYHGHRNLNPAGEWTPFEWEDPKHGSQAKGEVVVIRPEGTSGSLMSGLWRTGHQIAGCEADGSCDVVYSAPLGDETMVILEGSATITETATGRKHEIAAGTILSHPKHVDLHWEIREPFLKKFWVMWDSPNPATPKDELVVAHISDDRPGEWTPFEWDEPEHGRQVAGELLTIRDTGSTGTYMCGLWRTGVGIAGCNPDGTATIRYTAPLGDETILLLEGQVHVKNEATGEEFDFAAGDVIGFASGTPVTWTSKTPYVKKFWVITNEAVPTA